MSLFFALQPQVRAQQPAPAEKVPRLSGVTVQAARPAVSVNKGKIVYNVQQATNGAGQTALEVLTKVPGITVDGEGNIQFGGSAGVNVMVNGRMTWLSGPQLANFLKGLSAEDIARIETTVSPGASLDAAGNAGIINIITKKRPAQGWGVDLRSAISAGKYTMTNQQIAVHAGGRHLSVYGSFDYNTPHKFFTREGGNAVGPEQLERQTTTSQKIKYYTWRAGAEWKPAARHTIAVNYHGYLDDFTCLHESLLQIGGSTTASQNNIVEPYHYDAVNAGYRFDIDSSGKKFTVDADYTSYRNYSDALMTMQYYQPDGSFQRENKLASYQPGFVKIRSIKSDLELPFGQTTVKAGLKFAHVSNDNNYRFDSVVNGQLTNIANISDHFLYEERISAAYISAARRFDKTSITIGLRLEHTNADGTTAKSGVLNKWTYTQLFPSLLMEQALGEQQQLSLSISRRINRPAYTDLNPVRWYRDEYFYYSGNPALVPELAWSASAIYSLRSRYIFSLVYRRSNDYMSEQLAFDNYSPAIRSQRANFGTMQRVEATAAVPVAILPVWQLQLNSNVNFTTYPVTMIAGNRQLSQWAAALSLQQDISLPVGFKVSLATYYTTREVRGIFRTAAIWYQEAGVKKSWLQGRLNTMVSFNDIFDTYRLQGRSVSDFTNFWYNDKPDSRRVGVSVTYRLGGKVMKGYNRKTEEQERL
ncbi:outer membrane beta-barrel protein [Chitinophaga horti]|uniref:Outer membrane beta-barrel protein n=1 Tax=Chitinophaga horti TaxID=2920382 RepID=A0ABY6J799_9BACT|nr:outer membrane beta-barrel protein [Chitinophaga horti]UYQ94169.1 outer membrane beta-barrel protein [Chitinophaga horti]